MQIKSLLLAILCCLSVQAFSQTLCVNTGTPGSTNGITTSDFAQSITMGGGCTGEFAGLSIASSATLIDESAVWQLDIYQGDGFGGTLQYSQTGIALTQLGSYLFIKISGGSGSKAFTAGNQYTFRVSTTSPTNSVTVFRNTTSFYAGGQAYIDGAPISSGGDFRIIGVYTKAAVSSCGAATRLYVKHNASGSNNGTSWANAYTSLQSAIDYASGCSNIQEIWVAAGTYKPSVDAVGNASPTFANLKSFYIDFPIALYGGFAGTTETLLSQRNVASNPTILSGDIDNNDTANPAVTASDIQGTNAHAVVSIKTVEAGVTIDGFTVTAGKLAYGTPGGGIGNDGIGFPFGSSATIRNCKLQGNSGPAIYNAGNLGGDSGGRASLLVENSTLSGNSVNDYGAGIYSNSNGGRTSTTVNNCTFSSNTSTTTSRGGAYHEAAASGNGTATFSNCTFSGNSAVGNGAAVSVTASSGILSHTFNKCIFTSNTASLNGGAYSLTGAGSRNVDLAFTNCTFSNNTSSLNGGAFSMWGTSNAAIDATFTNNTFYNNTATNGGSAIHYSNTITPTNPLLLRNSILWQNTNEILIGGSATVTLSYSLINGASTPPGATNDNSLFNTDPLFVNAAGGNLRLQDCSPAINSGTSTGAPSTDLDNNPRPAQGGFDMGAYESQTSGGSTTYYRDQDGDGFGNPSITQTACTQPSGYVTNNTDCDDTDALEKPGQVWYKDSDSDGYAQTGAATITQCLRPTGYRVVTELLSTSGDCNDNDAAIKPGATEICDGIDNNCDGTIDGPSVCPNYTITNSAGAIVITDAAGNGETLNVSQNGANIRFDVTGRTYSLNGGATLNFPADVALAGASSITINTATGNDVINIAAFSANLPSLTINGGVGNDQVNFNGDITFATNANLDVDMQNDDATPGSDQVTFTNNANLVLSGTGAAVIKVSRNINFSNGTASLETTNGNLTLEANQQATATTGNFIGIAVSGATVRVNGTGTLTVKGKSGNDSAINQFGVLVQNGGLISGGTSGAATIQGSAGAASANGNIGVYVTGTNARITSLGSNVSVVGMGGSTGASSTCIGVSVTTNASITAGGSGTVTVSGTGGAGTGNFNAGVYVAGSANTFITSSGGNVSVTGVGGGNASSASNNNYGIWMEIGGTITAGNNGTVTVNGTGGATLAGSNFGVYVNGTTTAAQITSSGGNVMVTGFSGSTSGSNNYGITVQSGGQILAGGNGTLTVNGTGGSSTGDNNYGLYVLGIGSLISSSGGNVTVNGTGGGMSSASDVNLGIYLDNANNAGLSTISAGGTGSLTITGTGGPTSGSSNRGIRFTGYSQITSGGGNINITGIEGSAAVGIVHEGSSTITTATNGGNISFVANSIFIGSSTTVSTNNSSSTTLRQRTNGVQIDLGSAAELPNGPMGLADFELDRITTGTLIIGDANSGNLTVSAAITRPNSANVQLVSGGDVLISGGGFNTGGGTLLLDPGTSPAAVKPTFHGTDVTASTLSFASDLQIIINGTTIGNGTSGTYSQLNVAGAVNLTGVDLLFDGTYVPVAGNMFTIVSNDGSDAIVGTFTGLSEGATISNFRGSGLNATISYVGGTGNDVVITVAGPDYTISTAGNVITITDVAGNGDVLTATSNSGNIRFAVTPDTRTYSINGGAATSFATLAAVPLAGVTGIVINTSAGNDSISMGSFTSNFPSLTINGGLGDDIVNFAGDINFTSNANLDLDLQNDHATPGTDKVIITAASNLILTGTGSATVKLSRNLDISSSGSLETFNGNLTIETNQQTTPTSGPFVGLNLFGGIVRVNGTGILNIKAKGGTDNTALRDGVRLNFGALIQGGTSGTATIEGIGGAAPNPSGATVGVSVGVGTITSTGANVTVIGTNNGTLGACIGVSVSSLITAGGNGNVMVNGTGGAGGSLSRGVDVQGANGRITSSGGNVTVIGQGGGHTTSYYNYGVYLASSGSISSGGNGSVNVQGIGGVGSDIAGSNFGIYIQSAAQISAGGTGTVTVNGTGGASSGDNNHGVRIASANSKITSVAGNVSVTGQGGGTGASAGNYGVYLSTGGEITAGSGSTVTVQGTGGNSSGNDNFGVSISGSTSQITSTDGNISVTGLGGGSGSSSTNIGVYPNGGGKILAGGTGVVTLNGTGGTTSGNSNFGVYIISSATIGSNDGNINITGQGSGAGGSFGGIGVAILDSGQIQAGGNGNVVVQANGATAATGVSNWGLNLQTSASISTSNGNINITAQGGGSGTSTGNYGANINNGGLLNAGGSGTLTINGTGGSGSGSDNIGVRMAGTGTQITTGGGHIAITGIEGAGSLGISHSTLAQITTATNGGNIQLIANSMNLASAVSSQNTGTTTLRPYTNNVQINLGTATDAIGGPLGLSDTELDQITTGNLIIGNANSGNITVSAAITRPASTNVQLISGGDVLINGGGFNTGGGTLLLDPGTSPAAVKPTFNGTDVTASTLSFASDLSIAINGTTAGDGTASTYTQLNVVGAVNLTGVDLLFTGSYVPTGGETFTIVENDGSDAITGTFTGLAEGATLSNFRGSGLNATISYVGGSGNDVVITVISAAAPEINIKGNGFSILNGDTSPRTADGTDFGNIDIFSTDPVAHTFTIQNTGTANLVIPVGGITKSGSPDFGIGTVFLPFTIAPGDSATFPVIIDASGNGLRTATISIQSNDADESPYTFAVRAVGVSPEINVTGLGQNINSGDTTPSTLDDTDFGSVDVSVGIVSHTFTIQNTGGTGGDLYLNAGAITITGTHASDFSISGITLPDTTSPGQSVTFVVSFNPSVLGTRNATIRIANNDLGESTYSFAISGVGISPDYTITTTGNVLTITDIAGNGETLDISQNGTSIRFEVTGRNYSINGAAAQAFTTPADVPLAGITSIVVNTATGNDVINVNAFTTNLPSLTINGGIGNDQVNFNGDITFAPNANLDVDLQNDDANPGTDACAIGFGVGVVLSGTGTATVKMSKNLFIDQGGSIETENGNLTLEGNQQASSSTGYFTGIRINSGALVHSVNGNIALVGRGGTASQDIQHGIENLGTISTTGSGNVLLLGTGGQSGDDNDGIRNGGSVSATGGGDIQLQGFSNTIIASEAFANQPSASVTTTAGDIFIDGDLIFIDPASSISAGTNTVTIAPTTSGRIVHLGTDDTATQLGLTDSELDRITAATLIIGKANSGNLTVSAAISRPSSTNVQLISGVDVIISGGGFNTNGGALLLDPGMSPAAVKPTFNGTDVTASTLSFASDLQIAINGATAGDGTGSTYTQLNVAGAINLTGVDLLFAGTYVPTSANAFTIVVNDGIDAITGTFTGLAEGATLPNFRGSGLNATISYVGGTGNDVVITVCTVSTWYRDMDNDGFGNPAVSQQACSQPSGYILNNTDCDDNDALEKPGQIWYADVDNDGYSSGTTLTQCLRPAGYKVASELTAISGDCNDNNNAINPAATEICDGIDNNCNGSTDEGGLTTYYADADNDGFGNPAVSQQACSQPSGYVTNNTDCDDNDALEKPGQVWYADVDNDGYSSGTTLTQCLRPAGYKVAAELTATSGDCNDNNFAIKPGAPEICDGIDNNCNGSTDEGVLTTYYADADNDGFGNPAVSQQACSQPSGYVTNNTDCDDNDALEKPGQVWYADVDNDGYSSGTTLTQCLRPVGYKVASELTATSGDCNDNNNAINPAATEICDGIDNNCNGTTDEGVTTTYYADADNDGFGNPAVSQQACSQPSGYVTNNTDCDDNDALEKPGQVWYADVDNDGYSSGTTAIQCLRPTGYKTASELTATSGDCNDNVGSINPGATEICDGIDNNCNGTTDEGGLTTYYADADNDGFGNPAVSQQACSQPSGYVTNNTDCDDNDALEKPGQVWYADVDNDGYSSGTTLTQCLRPAGYKVASELTATSGDCNDNNFAIKPGAPEICDGIDNNCNGSTDEGVLTTYYADADNDGFGNPAVSQQACSQPSGYVTNNTDCDDNDALEKPGQVWYADVDNDGYSSGTTLTQCLRPAGYKLASELTATSGDCNDNNFAIKPGAPEICDGIDNNCNGSTDEGVTTTYYADADNDGFGNPAVSQQACSQPSGYVTNNTDCDDSDALEKPGQIWYADVDNDGYSDGTTLTQCLRPAGYKVAAELTATSGDCNDNNNTINPGATEICDGIDNNCDGVTDDGCTPTQVSIHDPCTCVNNAPVIENGTTTNAGTFSETVTIEGPSGQSWTIVSVSGLYSDINATTAYTAGTLIPETGAGTGVYELFGYHRDGAGYTIEVTNGDTILSIGNKCFYPDPVFTGLPAVVTASAAPFQVRGTVANNVAGTGTFLLDGVAQVGASAAPTVVTINPAALSPGSHTLEYRFDAGTITAKDSLDPGCVQVVRQSFQVAHCGCFDLTVSLDANCQFNLAALLVADGNCNGGTVRVMDNDPSNGGLIDCAGVWTYGLFDAFGNIICWGKVTAEDKTAPALVCAPADFTLDCYDVNYVLNNHLTIGNVGATSSPRPAPTSRQTIANAEGVAGTGDNCQLGLVPPGLVADNIKNLGYAYFKDNCYNCGCRITLKWSDKVEFYSCEQMRVNGGIYAKISREWVATDCNGMRSSYVQSIYFTRPAVDDFVFNGPGDGGKYDRVVEYNSCTPDKSLIKKEDVTPYVCSYFNTSANPRCLFIDQVECNYSVQIKDTEFPICGGKGVKIDRELYVFDWCAGGIVDTFHILIKIGDFAAPSLDYAHHAPFDISTGPMDCTAAIPVTVTGIKSQFGVTIKDNCNLGNVSVSVKTKDRYVKGILVAENVWEKVDYAVMNGMMIGLPVGRHRLIVDASDGCYNAKRDSFEFNVVDKIAPVMKCDDDLHVTLSNANGYTSGYAQVSADDIDEGSWDNCKLAWIAGRRNVPNSCEASFIAKGYDTNGNGKLDALGADNDYSKADGFDLNGDGDISDFGETFILKGGKLMTPLADFVEFFCCDLTERVTVELWGGDIYGNTNYCWMDLLIEDKVAPTCIAPWDLTIYCDDKNLAQIDDKVASAKIWGDVTIPTGNDCAALDTVYTTVKSLKCGAGYIDRIWTLTKQTVKGPITITCKQRIVIRPVHEYNICFPKDVSTDCKTPVIDTVLTDELACDILAVNVSDKRYDASDDECYKIFRTYTVINWCVYDDRCGDPMAEGKVYVVDRATFGNYGKNPLYVLVRDREDNVRDGIEEFYLSKDLTAANADDIRFTPPSCNPETPKFKEDNLIPVQGEYYHSFMYTQIIKVYDDTRPVVTGARDTFCTSPTLCTANITKVIKITDNCTDQVELETQFLMIAPFQTTDAGKMILYSTPRWSIVNVGGGIYNISVTNLPEGTHDLIVVGRDECGNLSLPTRIPFVVKDCKAPAPICINGLSTGIMPDGQGDGMMVVWATDFIASKIYDCNGQGPETKDGLKLVTKYSINRVGQAVNKDQTGLNFTCADINNSPILVELHAWDEAGNHDFCVTFVELIDSRNVCAGSASGVQIAGTIATEGAGKLQGASVTLSGTASQSANTSASGAYSFVNLAKGGDFTVTPQLDKNHLNGVSTFDLVLIQKHILGVQALNSPYKMIAADVNNSKSISTLDLIALRKLILNIDSHFANNTSWRFVDASYQFPTPGNPWSAAFPEVVSVNDIANNVTANFIAIKVGDINASASVSSAASAEIRTSGHFEIKTQEQGLKAGNEYKVTFTAEELKDMQGYQFALNLDQSKVELLDIEYGVAKAENFGVFKSEGLITTSWNAKYEPGPMFILVLRAKADAKLSQSLNLNRAVHPEAYNQHNENLGIKLAFEGEQSSDSYELKQNTPNPFHVETNIGFTLPKAMKATLTVRDVKGALIYKVEGNYPQGNNQLTLKKAQLGSSGVLYYSLETNDFTATKKMIILQ